MQLFIYSDEIKITFAEFLKKAEQIRFILNHILKTRKEPYYIILIQNLIRFFSGQN